MASLPSSSGAARPREGQMGRGPGETETEGALSEDIVAGRSGVEDPSSSSTRVVRVTLKSDFGERTNIFRGLCQREAGLCRNLVMHHTKIDKS